VGLCIPFWLPGDGSVNTFPRQRIIVGGVVFYVVRVVSRESRRLVLPRTFSFRRLSVMLDLCIDRSLIPYPADMFIIAE
jgi:hypothetical protein